MTFEQDVAKISYMYRAALFYELHANKEIEKIELDDKNWSAENFQKLYQLYHGITSLFQVVSGQAVREDTAVALKRFFADDSVMENVGGNRFKYSTYIYKHFTRRKYDKSVKFIIPIVKRNKDEYLSFFIEEVSQCAKQAIDLNNDEFEERLHDAVTHYEKKLKDFINRVNANRNSLFELKKAYSQEKFLLSLYYPASIDVYCKKNKSNPTSLRYKFQDTLTELSALSLFILNEFNDFASSLTKGKIKWSITKPDSSYSLDSNKKLYWRRMNTYDDTVSASKKQKIHIELSEDEEDYDIDDTFKQSDEMFTENAITSSNITATSEGIVLPNDFDPKGTPEQWTECFLNNIVFSTQIQINVGEELRKFIVRYISLMRGTNASGNYADMFYKACKFFTKNIKVTQFDIFILY